MFLFFVENTQMKHWIVNLYMHPPRCFKTGKLLNFYESFLNQRLWTCRENAQRHKLQGHGGWDQEKVWPPKNWG